ncbi:MAG: COX15/CtaA family protein [Opitutaceae bacterium]
MQLTDPASRPTEVSTYRPALAAFAGVAAAWVFLLITLGAFTTSINAGMAFPDWPLSNGSLDPRGWLSNLSMFAEHAHRLSAGVMTILTLALAVWIWVADRREWLRRLALAALILVILQAVVGGLRVLLQPDEVVSIDTSVGQLFAMLHACLAQAFVCVLIALALACSQSWIRRPCPVSRRLRRWGVVCCALLFVQLGIAAVMRHSFAGLAIPFFPWSGPGHRLLPLIWGFKVGINFAHRIMALILAVSLPALAVLVWRDRGASPAMRLAAGLLVALIALQIVLGASIILTFRDPAVTTAHVVVGAITLATTFWLTWIAHRDAIEGSPAGEET